MHYFVVFSFDLMELDNYNHVAVNTALEELGLKALIKTSNGEIVNLPKFTYIGEYQTEDSEELKNLLFTEIRTMFDKNHLRGNIFISVSKKAVIGVEFID